MGKSSGKKRKNNKKVVSQGFTPNPQKKAKHVEEPNYTKSIVWKFGRMDHEGEWGWDKVTKEELIEEILPKIKSFETMSFAQLAPQRSNHHSMPVKNLSQPAKNRITEIALNQDDLFSFKISGQKRLWGTTVENEFHVLWWDPEHTVYPVDKSHT